MKATTNYQEAKKELKFIADFAKKEYKNDLPAVRTYINDSVNWVSDNYDLSNYKNSLLHDYACKLHPKQK